MEIPLTRGKVAIIDDDDYELISKYSWSCRVDNYAMALGKIRMHRLIVGLPVGDPRWVDHINGDTLDNRKSNLRICTASQNIANSRHRISNRSGFKGVSWDADRNKWYASIKFHRKSRGLGRFNSKEAAAKAYDNAAVELFGEFALTNSKLGLL